MPLKCFRAKQSSHSPLISTLAAFSSLLSSAAYAETQPNQVNQNFKNDSSLIQAISNDPMVVSPSSKVLQPDTGESAIIHQINQELVSNPTDKHGKGVSSVSQLSDVRSTDWAFTALQSLVERYGCIAGYPDRTFQGKQATSRYEFASGLNACLDKINEIISAGLADKVSKEDLSRLKKLQEEFATELVSIRQRVDILETKASRLEAQEFSPTTKLYGQAIFGVQGRFSNQADLFPRDGIRETIDPGTNINVISNVQLTLLTQLTDRSFLLTGIQAGSGSTFPSLTNNTRLAYESPTNNNLVLSDLTYRFLIGDKFAAYVGAAGVNPVTAFRGANRVASAGSGPISFFAQRNPILNIGFGSTGVGFDWQFAEKASIQAVYAATTASNPTQGNGLFNGGYVIGSQLVVTPVPPLDISLYYLNSYSPFGFLGTGTGDDQLIPFLGQSSPLLTHAIGTTVNWQVNSKFTIGGWGGYTISSVPSLTGAVETFNWMLYLNFPDMFEGNLGGIYIWSASQDH